MAVARAHLTLNQSGIQAVIEDTGTKAVARLARRVVAQAKMNAPVDTGNLRNQITADPLVVQGSSVKQTITVNGSAAEYSIYVHEGTRPHVIRPRNKKVLAFNGKEGKVFARSVNHPGTRARPFLRNAVNSEAPALGFQVTNR